MTCTRVAVAQLALQSSSADMIELDRNIFHEFVLIPQGI